MCNQADLKEGKCRINDNVCPYLYYCNRIQGYKELSSMPVDCKVKEQIELPKGTYKVRFERSGNLYVSVNGQIVVIKNPIDHTPTCVKMSKLKNGEWKIKQTMG